MGSCVSPPRPGQVALLKLENGLARLSLGPNETLNPASGRGMMETEMAKKDEAKVEGEAAAVEPADGPLLDLNDAAVKRMLKVAKKRGWVTQDELNAVLPSEEISSDQIEDMNAMLSEMGINVVDNEDAEEAEKETAEADDDEPEGGELVET